MTTFSAYPQKAAVPQSTQLRSFSGDNLLSETCHLVGWNIKDHVAVLILSFAEPLVQTSRWRSYCPKRSGRAGLLSLRPGSENGDGTADLRETTLFAGSAEQREEFVDFLHIWFRFDIKFGWNRLSI